MVTAVFLKNMSFSGGKYHRNSIENDYCGTNITITTTESE